MIKNRALKNTMPMINNKTLWTQRNTFLCIPALSILFESIATLKPATSFESANRNLFKIMWTFITAFQVKCQIFQLTGLFSPIFESLLKTSLGACARNFSLLACYSDPYTLLSQNTLGKSLFVLNQPTQHHLFFLAKSPFRTRCSLSFNTGRLLLNSCMGHVKTIKGW